MQLYKKKPHIQIICTIGPTSQSEKIMRGLIRAGADALRINLSHTPFPLAIQLLARMRAISKKIPIIIDTQGKETRIMAPDGKPLILKKNERISIVPFGIRVKEKSLWITRLEILELIPKKSKIFLDDNQIVLSPDTKRDTRKGIRSYIVTTGGTISVPKNIRLEKKMEPKSMLTDMDRATIKKSLSYGISEVSLSYVNDAQDVQEARTFIGKKKIRVTSKIETEKALRNLEELIKASDAIFIDRNDLGTEIGYEKIPLIQKFITQRCASAGMEIFVATHILESMIKKNKPTRGEANDIINLVLDGVDGLVLSSETAIGENPVLIVKTLKKLIQQGEFILHHKEKAPLADVIGRLQDLNYL
ncbi:MAG: pyruvate kinase [Patescibacteria group bacterium]|nr:pyruvate kinase [Patescibacteria group bacterium]